MDPKHSTDLLHPFVYRAIVALTVVFILAAWGFAGGGYVSWVLAVVTLFGVIVVGIPLEIWRIWRNHRTTTGDAAQESFHDWLAGDFDTWQERLSGMDAAITLLLPIAAAAFGAIAFAIVFQVISHNH